VADLYETLGVGSNASDQEIRSAYRKLAREHHPDANPDDPKAGERFKEISHAYDVLSDESKRRDYDAARTTFGRRQGSAGGPRRNPYDGPFGDASDGAGGGGFSDFADLFGSIFRNRDGTQTPGAARRGGDIEVDVNLSFEQAMRGARVPITVEKREPCPQCDGSGAKSGTSARLCPDCRGRGVVGREAGGFDLTRPCPTCNGVGTVVDDPCATCEGVGTRPARRKYQVKIPPGAKDGTKVRLKGRGQAGTGGGPTGDLLVVCRVTPSPIFNRRGDDLEIEVPVTFAEAALGARVEVPTLGSKIAITVPAGSDDGKALRVAGHGAPSPKGDGHGDLIARLRVQVPETLTDEQREALERYAELDDHDPRSALFQ
jgi:molecular chaperone DnaJ